MSRFIFLVTIATAATMSLHAQGPSRTQPTPRTTTNPPRQSAAPKHAYTVVRSFPHDPTAFTQGLEYFNGFLYEGTGIKGKSGVRKVELETGKVLQEERLHPQYFGEGITISQGKLFQVTWQDRLGLVYDARTLKFIRNFTYLGEGWGLTHDSAGLIMSDGTNTLRFFELTRFQERRRIEVRDGGVPITGLNELEWVRGEIWANIWGSDYIVRISPANGRVVGWINMEGLKGSLRLGTDAVLNGIAYDPQKNRIFVTGKLWPRLYEITVK